MLDQLSANHEKYIESSVRIHFAPVIPGVHKPKTSFTAVNLLEPEANHSSVFVVEIYNTLILTYTAVCSSHSPFLSLNITSPFNCFN